MVGTHVDRAAVRSQVIDPVWDRFAQRRVYEIVDVDTLRFTLASPFATSVLEATNQFLPLGVHGDHRRTRRQTAAHSFVEIVELGIAVSMLPAFQRLRIALQAVAQPRSCPPATR